MKASYDRETDTALVELSSKKIDYAQDSGDLIIHFAGDDSPVLLEILDASKFLAGLIQVSLRARSEKPVTI